MPALHTLRKKYFDRQRFQELCRRTLCHPGSRLPPAKKIPAPRRSQYEALAGEFNTEGAFPKIVLLTPDKTLLAVLPYTGQSPADFMGEVRKLLKP